MFKKLYRGLYLFLFVMFVTGSFCLFPSLKGINANATEVAQNTVQDVPPETLPTAKWSEIWKASSVWGSANEMSSDSEFSGTSAYQNIQNAFVIQNSDELAKAAYLINSDSAGNTYRNATWVIDPANQTFDMGAALWTPIGTIDHPFTGVFYGNGITIKNISIEDIACEKSHAGLFGTIQGASITDIRLDGYQTISVSATISGTSTPRIVGALVGQSISSYIINCHDELTSRTSMLGTETSIDYKSVGNIDASSYVFRGKIRSLNINNSNNSFTSNLSPKTLGDTLTVDGSGYQSGYVAFYYAKEGKFNINDLVNPTGNINSNGEGAMVEWPDHGGKVARVLLDSENQTIKITTQKAQLYRGEFITLRNTATANQLFVLNPGNKAVTDSENKITNVPNISNGEVFTVQYTKTDIIVKFDYGYGNRGYGVERSGGTNTLPVAFGYDQSFRSYFGIYPAYTKRAGYEFANLKRGSVIQDAVADRVLDSNNNEITDMSNEPLYYRTSFPENDNIYTFSGTRDDTRSYQVKFAYASNEGGLLADNDFAKNYGAFIENVSLAPNTVQTTYGKVGIEGDTDTFTITLKPGYSITSLETDNSNDIEITENKADKLSGVYPLFTTLSGIDEKYSDSNVNNDFYNQVKTSISWTNREEYENASIKTGENGLGKTYTVTVDNLVSATAGDVYIVIERDFMSIDLTPTNVDGDNGLNYRFESNDLTGYADNKFKLAYIEYTKADGSRDTYDSSAPEKQLTDGSNPVLYVRYKESLLDLIIRETNKYLLNKSSENEFENAEVSFNYSEISGPNSYKDTPVEEEGTKPDYANYYNCWKLDFNKMKYSYNKLTIYIGSLKSKVDIASYKYVDADNKVLMLESEMSGLGIYLQSGSTGYLQTTNVDVSMANQDQIYVARNGNYQVKYVIVYDLATSKDLTLASKVTLTAGTELFKFGDGTNNDTINANNYYVAYYGVTGEGKIFKNAYSDVTGTNYRIEVVYEERGHDIKFEYYIGSGAFNAGGYKAIDEDNYNIFFAEGCPNLLYPKCRPSALSGGHYTFNYKLNSVGLGSISYAGYEIMQDEKLAIRSDGYGTNQLTEFKDRTGFTVSSIKNLSTNSAEGSFDVNLGGYATVVKVYFSLKSGQEILVNKLFVDGVGGGLKNDVTGLLNTITFSGLSYNFDGTALSLKSDAPLDGISIHSQYYLLGWYLINGEVVVENNYGGFLTDSNFVYAVATHYSSSSSPFDGIAAFVGQREVKVSYYTDTTTADGKGYGQIYDRNKNIIPEGTSINTEFYDVEYASEVSKFTAYAFNVKYNEEKTVDKNIFFNIGYTFGKYLPQYGVMSEDGNTYVLNATHWANAFNSLSHTGFNDIDQATSMQVWKNVINTTETQSDDDRNQMLAYVNLVIKWDIINYFAIIDETNSVSDANGNMLSIGDKITYSTDKNAKNGQATYIFTNPKEERPVSNYGTLINGYVVTGIKITHKEGLDGKTFTDEEWNDGNGSFVLTPDVLRSFLKEEYYFAVNNNDDKINFTTLRDPAEYYIELIPSDNNYYTYTWNERGNSADYGFYDNSSRTIKIKVTYNSPASNLTEAKRLGFLEINRLGYSPTGWVYATDGQDTQTNVIFDPTKDYAETKDIRVVPTWAPLTNKATTSKIEFNEDVTARQFYLLTSHNITTGTVGCSNSTNDHLNGVSTVTKNRILANGEKIIGYQFEVTLLNNGSPVTQIFTDINQFDIKTLAKSGSYNIIFRLTIKDSLTIINASGIATEHIYEQISGILNFEMLKNELFFYDHDLKSVYTGTNEFVAGKTNEFGNVKLRYEWNGEELESGSIIGSTVDYFDTVNGIEVVGSGEALDAGINKSLKIKFNYDNFNSKFQDYGKPGEDKKFEDLLTNGTYDKALKSDNNISNNEDGYFVTFTDALEIEKAVFVISFPAGASYYFEGMEVVAFTNYNGSQQLSYPHQVGKEVFSYTFSQITIVPDREGDTKPNTYKGQENHIEDEKVFVVHDLEIFKNNVAEKLSNFEWIISKDSQFQVIGSETALGLNYTTKYLTAQNGQLNEISETYSYNGEIKQDTLYLSNLMIDNKAYEIKSIVDGDVKIDIKGNQGSIYINNIILLSYVGNNTTALQVIVNKDLLNSADKIKYDVNVDLSSQRKSQLKLLEFVEDTFIDTAKISNATFQENVSKLFDDGVDSLYNTKVSLPDEAYFAKHNIYAVLTDAVKVVIDFNNKVKEEENEKQIVYASLSSGTFRITNPTHEDSAYLKFNGYRNSLGNASHIRIEETVGPGDCAFTNVEAGSTENIKAKWEFTNFKYDILDDVIDTNAGGDTLYASASEIVYELTNFMEIDAPKTAELSISMVSTTKYAQDGSSKISFVYVPDQKAFRFVDWNGQASVKLNDTYKVTVTYTFDDKASPTAQKLTVTKDVTLALTRNTIEFTYEDTSLTFRNSNQEGRVNVSLSLNGEENGRTTLSLIPTSAIAGNSLHFHAVVKDSKNNNALLNQVDTYTVTNTIDENMVDVYQFGVDSGNNPINNKDIVIKINQYEITLADYVDKFEPTNIEKFFGQPDQNPIFEILEITEELDTPASVQVNFGRETSEAIGKHRLENPTFTTDADNNNYIIVDKDTFEAYYTIKTPSAKLQVELSDYLTYIYNGRAVSEYNVTYNPTTKKFNLTIVAGEDSDTIEFDIYYNYGTQRIDIPDTQRETYAGYLTFGSNSSVEANLEGYTLTVSLTDTAKADNWKEIDFDNTTAINAKIIVTKRELKVTSITKVYDGTTKFVYNTISANENTCEIIFREGDVVRYDGDVVRLDEIQLSGEFVSAYNGEQALKNGTFRIDEKGVGVNYTLVYDSSLKVNLVADATSEIDYITALIEVVYKTFKESNIEDPSELQRVLDNFNFTYNYKGGSEIDKTRFTIIDVDIEQKDIYSKGTFLNVGDYTVKFTIQSKDFTFGQTRGELGETYTTTFTKPLKVTKRNLTIANAQAISKKYDGNENLLSTFINQNVNAVGGYYSSNEALEGDIITVLSGKFGSRTSGEFVADHLYGTGKAIDLVFDKDNDDSNNYEITITVVGDITAVELYFNRVGNTQKFVDDDIDNFTNDGIISVEYAGEMDTFIRNLLNAERIGRDGYICIGYRFGSAGGVQISTDVSIMSAEEKETFLQAAVDAGRTGLEIYAIWERKTYKVTVQITNGVLKNENGDDVSTVIANIPYFNTLEDGTIYSDYFVTADEGYKFGGINASELSSLITAKVVSGNKTKNGKISLEKIKGDCTLKITIEEIKVRIVIDPSQRTGFTVSSTNEKWLSEDGSYNIWDRTISYSDLLKENLPVVAYDRGYLFTHWTMNGVESASAIENLWLRINGATLTEDVTDTRFTFTANWQEDKIFITFNHPHSSIAVYDLGTTEDPLNTLIVANSDDKYETRFSHNIKVVITADDFYKWTNVALDSGINEKLEDLEARNNKSGAFEIKYIQTNNTITITSSPITFTFKTNYEIPVETEIAEAKGAIKGEFAIEKGDVDYKNTTLADMFGATYTPTVGTYTQTGWSKSGSKDKNFSLDIKVTEVIYALLGTPQQDIELTLDAFFEGVDYEVTFVNTNTLEYRFAVEGEVTSVARTIRYGSTLTNVPSLIAKDGSRGEEYVWLIMSGEGENRKIETFENGQQFTLKYFKSSSVDNYTLRLEATWGFVYKISIKVTGTSEVMDKLISIDGTEYTGDIQLTYFNGVERYFMFNLEKGYEIYSVTGFHEGDSYAFKGDELDGSGRKNYLLVSGFVTAEGETENRRTITVELRPKSYNVTIETSDKNHYQFTGASGETNEFTINYDEDIRPYFATRRLTRDGFNLAGLSLNGNKVASFDGTTFTFNAPLVYEDNTNIYCYDDAKAFTLSPIWERKSGSNYTYFAVTTNATTGLVYNSSEQTIATSTILINGTPAHLELGTVPTTLNPLLLANGEQIVEIYYVVNGRTGVAYDYESISAGSTSVMRLKLNYKDVISGNAHMYVRLVDSLSPNDEGRIITSDPANIEIAKADIAINGANLESYYTGTSTYVPTANGQNLGNVVFAGVTPVLANGELIIDKIEIVDETNKYGAVDGKNYSVKYYFRKNGFNSANYVDGIFADETATTITYVADAVTTTIIKTPIELSFVEQGFFKGSAHKVSNVNAEILKAVTDIVGDKFIVDIASVYTNGSDAIAYNTIEQFVVNSSIYTNDSTDNLLANFIYTLASGASFTIISLDNAFTVNVGARYFDTTTLEENNNTDNIVKILSFEFNGRLVNADDGDMNYITQEGTLVLSIVNNGTKDLRVIVANDRVVTFNLEIATVSPMAVLRWTSLSYGNNESDKQLFVEGLLNSLNILTLQDITTTAQFVTTNTDITYVAVITDYKAVELSLDDVIATNSDDEEINSLGFTYVKLGSEITISNPETALGDIKGFEFSNWSIGQVPNISIEGLKLRAEENAGIYSCKITAIWTLETPNITGKDFDFDADVVYGKTREITLSDILTKGIENYNKQITYKYVLTKDGTEIEGIAENDSFKFSLPCNSDSTGDYYLTVTATSGNNRTDQAKEVKIKITVNLLKLTSVTFETTGIDYDIDGLVYSNRDFVNDILVTITGGGLGQYALKDLLNNADLSYRFSISYRKELSNPVNNSTDIKNAGIYVISLDADSRIFDTSEITETQLNYQVTVAKQEIVISLSDIPSTMRSKLFGDNDPERFIFTKSMFTGDYAQTAYLELFREIGENQGVYKFNRAVVLDSTYAVVDDNFIARLDETAVYTIEKADITVTVTFEDDTIAKVYDKVAPQFRLEYRLDNEWYVYIDNNQYTKLLLSYEYADGSEASLQDRFKELVLENMTLTTSVFEADTYAKEDMLLSGEGNFSSYKLEGGFVINKRLLTFEDVNPIYKEFDRTNVITKTDARFTNVVEGDEVYITGFYEKAEVGLYALSGIELVGANSSNYSIPSVAEFSYTGTIIPRKDTGDVLFTIENTNFIYGDINLNDDISEILKLVGEYTLSIGDITTDIENGFVSISAIRFENGESTVGNNLKAGKNRKIIFVISSPNFELFKDGYEYGRGDSANAIIVNIDKRPLDLSGIPAIYKPYDTNNKLPAEVGDYDISSFVRPGDDVKIDANKGGFDNAEIGINKHITLVLSGADAVNYTVLDNLTGVIAPYIIDVTVETEVEHSTLVNDGRFVSDGESASRIDSFKVSYPFDESVTASSLMNSFVRPTRKGYDFKGWYISDGNGGYTVLNANNIEDVLHSIALNPSVEDALTIYAGWEIQVYTLTLNYNNVESISVTANPQSALTENEGMYFVRYFTDLEVNFVAERGYKILAHTKLSGEASDVNLGDTGRIVSTVSIRGIASNFALQTTLDEIQITFAINANIPDFTVRTDGNNLQPRLYYSLLADKTESDLPALTVTEGTYTLSNYTYFDSASGTYKLLDGKSLKEIVDTVYTSLEGDSVITLRANWLGELYTVMFNANGGTITGTNKREVRFGSEITTFPVVKNPGKYPVWQDVNGKVYEEGNRLSSIGIKDDNGYTLTLSANWENDTFDLVVTFDEGVIVTNRDGNALVSGDVIRITYNDPAIRLNVDVIKGYQYSYSSSNVNGDFVDLNGGQYSIQNLIANSSIYFAKEPANNTLSIRNTNIDSFEVKVNGIVVNPTLVQGAYQIIAKTEQEVVITYKAKKGYEFEEGNTYDFLTDGLGSEGGNVTATVSEDKKTLTIVWNNFVTGASINARAVPSTNIVEFGDVRDIFAQLSFNSTNMNLSGGTFPIKTGTQLSIEGYMAFGFKGGNLSTGDKNYVVEGSVKNEHTTGEKYYRFTAVVDGFDEGFTITFSGSPRTFKFNVSVASGEETYGEITCDTYQEVDYKKSIILAQQELVDNYEFICWKIGDRIISTEGNTTVVIDEDFESELTAVGEEGTVEIKAYYARKVRDITLTSTGKGGFVASQTSENVRIEVNGFVTQKFYLGIDLVIDLVPSEGYELSYILIDGQRVTDEDMEKYGYNGSSFAIPLDLENPIQTLEVIFKPCEIYINVQAGTIINFIPNLGSVAGGHIYVTDAEGERLGNEVYLEYEGNLVVGGNYKFLSHTDETIYLEIKPKTGFTASLIIDTPGVTVSKFKKADGTEITIVNGAKDSTKITVLFTAKENSVKILFANEGEDIKAVHGGVIVVDTSSALVSSSPTRGDSVNAFVVTGERLDVTINSLSSYYLVTNPDGTLKYDIIYAPNAEEEFRNVNIGEVKTQQPLMSGFNNSSSISIGQVNVSATIVIYVKPIDYTIRFVVDDGVAPVVMSQTVRYGEEWSLDSLTAEQKALVFAEKPNYTFTGYYTGTNSYGTQYIDRYREITQSWQHSGYFYNGTAWEEEKNFDSVSKSFTLYAGWTFNSAKVKLEVSPEIAIDDSYNVRSFIANIEQISAFVGQDDVWLATAAVDEILSFAAPAIYGYTFANFAVKFNDGEYSNRGTTFDLKLEMGDYFVRAVYNPNFTINVENVNNDDADGGTSYVKQDNNLINGNFDTSKLVTLFAKPADGYAFLYWIDNTTGNKIYGEENGEGEYVYTFADYIYKPLNLTAVFKGKEIEVNFNSTDLGSAHIIRGVLVNGEIVDYTKPFNAFVGDTIVVRVSKVRGYGFGDSLFTSVYDEQSGYYVFSYVFKVEDLEVKEEGLSYKIGLSIPVTIEDITMNFNINMFDPVDNSEVSKSGAFEWISEDGNRTNIENGGSRTVKYGSSYALAIRAQSNYRYKNAYLVSSGITFDISGFVVDNQLLINKDFLDRFFDYEININVYFERLLWIDEDVIAETFTGLGTDDDPYLITNVNEFALLAYLVNNGMSNNDGKLYSECSYLVTADINFEGRYWVPVGTEENPFKGKIDLGSYHYDNVVHYTSYPGSRFGGLFWYIDETAQVTQNQKTFTTMIVLICVSILLLIILIILFILWTRRRKKKLEKLSSQ